MDRGEPIFPKCNSLLSYIKLVSAVDGNEYQHPTNITNNKSDFYW